MSSTKPLPPGSTIGILGGGQLGRMTALAAARMGYRCIVYSPEEHSIGGDVAAGHAVVAAAGGRITDSSGTALVFGAGGRKDFIVPEFIAWGDPNATP